MKLRHKASLLLLLSVLALPGFARREPLNNAEIAEIRDAAQEPDKRVRLFVKFIRTRATALEQLRLDPRFSADRNHKIHDLLDDITALLDEMDDNLDQFAERRANLRKPLKDVTELDNDLATKLRAMKQTVSGPQSEAARAYGFVLDSAIDAVNGSLDHARTLLEAQEASQKEQKAKKK